MSGARAGCSRSMRFTMAQPEVSCHPETLLEGARTVVSAALCYYAPGLEPRPGEGRLPRYAWRDHYAVLRERLDALGRRLGGRYRVLVDANQHVDRAGAERSGIGFIGKNTMLITRAHGSWVILGTLVTDVDVEPTRRSTPAAAAARSASTPARPVRSTSRPGCSTRRDACRTGRRRPRDMPDDVMDALEDRVYGCDICQDVCPWNRGVEKRRADIGSLPGRPAVGVPPRVARGRRQRARRPARAALRTAQRPALAAAERPRRGRERRRAGGARGRRATR